jgi:nucleotide-binding universal stress UspA family protein
MSTIDRIVVAQDVEHEELWVIDAAIQLADETEAEIVVVVVDDVESQRFEALPRSELAARASERATLAQERLAGAGARGRAVARSGPTVPTVIEVAAEEDADLIVVGGGQRPALVERLLGSVSLELIQQAGRQVLVVTPPAS